MRSRHFSSAFAALLIAAPLAAASPVTLATPEGLSVTLVTSPVPDPRLSAVGAAAPGHYLHPIRVAGIPLTELFPADHVHHRGLFWGWRQILIDGRPVANGWLLTGLEMQPRRVRPGRDGTTATSRLRWHVGGRPILEERLHLRVDGLVLTVELDLVALVPGLALGGSPDAKEYGGLSLRLVEAERLRFESEGRPVEAAVGPVEASPTMRFSWDEGAPAPARAITLSCTADGQPITRWVLRRERSMQNCVWPGAAPVALPRGRPVRLTARLSVEP